MFWHAALLCISNWVWVFSCKFVSYNVSLELVEHIIFCSHLLGSPPPPKKNHTKKKKSDLLCFVSNHLRLYLCWINYSWDTGGEAAFVEIAFMLVFVYCEIIKIRCSFRVGVGCWQHQ